MGFRWRFGRSGKTGFSGSGGEGAGCSRAPEFDCQRLNLSEVEPGTSVEICCLEGEGPLSRRLAEMGFLPGTRVDVLRRAPLSDPIEFELRGYLISLRREEARRVRIKPLEQAAGTSTETAAA